MNIVGAKKRGRPKGSKNKVRSDKPSKYKTIKLSVDYTKYGLGIKEYKAFEIPTLIEELKKGDRVLIADGREGEFVSANKDETSSTIRMDDTKLYSIRNECIRKKIVRST